MPCSWWPCCGQTAYDAFLWGGSSNSANEGFNASTGLWASVTAAPANIFAPASAAIGGLVYSMAGLISSTDRRTYEYDQSSDSWTQLSDYPAPWRSRPQATVVGTAIYMCGGANGLQSFADNEEYVPSTDTWTSKTDMGTARGRHAPYAINSRCYAATGGTGANATVGVTKSNEEYDPSGDSWASKTDFAGTGRIQTCGTAVGTKGYVFSGGGGLSDAYEYDAVGDSWTAKTSLSTDYRGSSSFTIGSLAYVAGGTSGGGTDTTPATQIYDPSGDSWSIGGSVGSSHQEGGGAAV